MAIAAADSWGYVLRTWTTPEEPAVLLVWETGGLREALENGGVSFLKRGDKGDFRCHGCMRAKRRRYSLRVGRGEAMDCSHTSLVLLALCPLCSEGSRKFS